MDLDTVKYLAPIILAFGLAVIGLVRKVIDVSSEVDKLRGRLVLIEDEVVKCRSEHAAQEELLREPMPSDIPAIEIDVRKIAEAAGLTGNIAQMRDFIQFIKERRRKRREEQGQGK